ncbi:hypothetical protein Btru_074316 [Bulinus truncatus]|nr:hypothetical protein Btru_074316 [Bulinus truncatus]
MNGFSFGRSCLYLCKKSGISYSRSINAFTSQWCGYSPLFDKWKVTPVINSKLGRGYSQTTDDNKIAELERLRSEMNIRLANENGFLSWCRNAYLSTVVGVAMITEGTTELALDAGFSALFIATLNIFWGTGSYITNLIRLRNASGMSPVTLFVNIIGSFLHSLIWCFVVICYLGFLDENDSYGPTPLTNSRKKKDSKQES